MIKEEEEEELSSFLVSLNYFASAQEGGKWADCMPASLNSCASHIVF